MANFSQVGHLLDIPLEVEAVVEGYALRVSELLELAVGSLVVSGRAAGENVDVMAGRALLGSGAFLPHPAAFRRLCMEGRAT